MLGRAVLECLILRFKCSNPAALATVTKSRGEKRKKLVNKSWFFFRNALNTTVQGADKKSARIIMTTSLSVPPEISRLDPKLITLG
jgi:hypothetical protein